MNNTLIVGLLVLEASFVIGVRQVLLGPNAVNFPRGEPVARVVMFIWSATLLLRGADLMLSWLEGRAEPVANVALLPSFMLAVVQTIMLHNTLRQRLPASMWRRIDRAIYLATCVSAWDRLRTWLTGHQTFEQSRRSALTRARAQSTMSAHQAAIAMGEAALRGDQIVVPKEVPNEWKPGRLH